MFFFASKVIWYFLQPSTFLIILFALGVLLLWRHRSRAAIQLMLGAAGIYAIGALTPLSNAILLGLEQQYTPPSLAKLDRIDGIIVLGGMVDTLVSAARDEIALNEAAERLTETAVIARRFPASRIVLSGGDGALLYRSTDEASVAKRFFTQIGIDPDRITVETQSRNTWQNAVFTKELIKPKPGERWLLITSAFHMPRAIGCFRAAEFDVIPWPVDFRTRGWADLLRFPPGASAGWKRIDLTTKEWIGYVAYWATGRLK